MPNTNKDIVRIWEQEDVYQKATLKELGSNALGTRMDVVYTAMDMWAEKQSTLFYEWAEQSYTRVESKELNTRAWVNCVENEVYVNGSDAHFTRLIKEHGKTTKELYKLFLIYQNDKI